VARLQPTLRRAADEPEIERVAPDIQRQEEAMADWAWESIPMLMRKCLQRSAADMTAKR